VGGRTNWAGMGGDAPVMGGVHVLRGVMRLVHSTWLVGIYIHSAIHLRPNPHTTLQA